MKKGSDGFKQRACDALTEHIYVRPKLEILNEYSGSAWRYVYDHPLSGNSMGCFHASELPVLFGLNMLGIDGEKDDTGAEMRRIWGEFAKNTNPGWEIGSTSIIQ